MPNTHLTLLLAAIPFVIVYFIFQEKVYRRTDTSIRNLDTIGIALSVLAVLVFWVCSLASL